MAVLFERLGELGALLQMLLPPAQLVVLKSQNSKGGLPAAPTL